MVCFVQHSNKDYTIVRGKGISLGTYLTITSLLALHYNLYRHSIALNKK